MYFINASNSVVRTTDEFIGQSNIDDMVFITNYISTEVIISKGLLPKLTKIKGTTLLFVAILIITLWMNNKFLLQDQYCFVVQILLSLLYMRYLDCQFLSLYDIYTG